MAQSTDSTAENQPFAVASQLLSPTTGYKDNFNLNHIPKSSLTLLGRSQVQLPDKTVPSRLGASELTLKPMPKATFKFFICLAL